MINFVQWPQTPELFAAEGKELKQQVVIVVVVIAESEKTSSARYLLDSVEAAQWSRAILSVWLRDQSTLLPPLSCNQKFACQFHLKRPVWSHKQDGSASNKSEAEVVID